MNGCGRKSPISTTSMFLNKYQVITDAQICMGIMLQNRINYLNLRLEKLRDEFF
jgi:hypothetical protein